jgi:hypothetical protein
MKIFPSATGSFSLVSGAGRVGGKTRAVPLFFSSLKAGLPMLMLGGQLFFMGVAARFCGALGFSGLFVGLVCRRMPFGGRGGFQSEFPEKLKDVLLQHCDVFEIYALRPRLLVFGASKNTYKFFPSVVVDFLVFTAKSRL